jgi:outer membrane protein insertion porin family
MKKILLSCFFLVACTVLFTAQSFAAVVDLVEIEGNRRVPSSTFLKYTVRPGTEFDMEAVDKSIKDIFATDLVSDVQVDMSVDDDRLILTYIVKEKPYVGRVYFEGNSNVKERYLLEDLIPMEGEIINNGKIEANIKQIIATYNDERYYAATVKANIEERDDNTVDIVFSIDEGPEARIYTINFIGNNFYNRKKLRKIISTNEKGFFSWLTGSGKLKKEELGIDVERIKNEYMKEGYVNIRVGDPDVELDDNKKKITLTFRIDEGSRYKIKSIEFSGQKHRTERELASVVKLNSGDWFNVEEFQNDIKNRLRFCEH